MKTTTQFFALLILGMMVLSCGNTQSSKTAEKQEKPSKTIHEATFFGDLEGIKAHIAFGTDLNQKDDFGSTPLNVAITFGKTDIAQALINGGADLNITTADGSTALHSAAFFGRVEVADLLIQKEVALNSTNDYGATAMTNASTPFEQMKPIYDQVRKDLGPFGFTIDYEELQTNRKAIADLLARAQKNQ